MVVVAAEADGKMNPFDKLNAQQDVVDLNEWLAGQQRQRQPTQKAQPQKEQGNDLVDTLLNFVPFGTIGKQVATGHAGDISAGDLALEAALTFVPFGKVAKGIGGVAKGVLKGGEKASTQAVVKGTSPLLQNAGDALTKMSTIAPKSTIDRAGEQNALVDLVQKTPGLSGGAAKKFQDVEGEINKMTNQVDTLLGSVKNTLPVNNFVTKVENIAGSIPEKLDQDNFRRVYNRSIKGVFGDTVPTELSATQVNALRREMNKQASGAFRKMNAGTPLTSQDQAIMALRDELGTMIEDLTPAKLKSQVKELNRNQGTLINAIPEFKKNSEQGMNVFGMQVPGSKLPFQAVQAATDKAGRVATGLGGSSLPARIARNAGGQIGRRAVVGGIGGGLPPDVTRDGSPGIGAVDQSMTMDTGSMPPTTDGMGGQFTQEQTPYSRENLMYDLQRDPQNAEKYIAYYQTLDKVFGAPKQAKFSSATAGAITDMQKGLQTLQDLKGMVTGGDYAGGVVQGNVRQFNPFDNSFKQQQAMVDASRQIVGKALEGGVLRKEDEEKYKRILPTMQDAPEVAASKLDYIQSVIQQNLQRYSGLVSGGSPLEDALMQGQQGY